MLGKKPTMIAGLFVLALLAFGPALVMADEVQEPAAEETTEAAPEASPETAVPAPHSALGMVVVLDEETGQLRAPREGELETLSNVHDFSQLDGYDLPSFESADGTVTLQLDERFHKRVVLGVDGMTATGPQHDVMVVHLPKEDSAETTEADADEAGSAEKETTTDEEVKE